MAELVPIATALPDGEGPDRDDVRERLARHAALADGAFADATVRARRANTLLFVTWCAMRGREPLPASPDTVAAFLDAMANGESLTVTLPGRRPLVIDRPRKPATLERYASSIAALHRAAGLPDPRSADAVRFALRRHWNAQGRMQRQARGLTFDLRQRLLEPEPRSLLESRDRALLVVAYGTLCRCGELVTLDVEDLTRGADGDAVITVRRSQTDQEGEGSDRYLAPDTVAVLDAWLSAAGVTEGQLFRAVRKNGVPGKPLQGQEVPRLFRALAQRAGVPERAMAELSGHSTRVGAAQDLATAGVALPEIMQAGGWKAPTMVVGRQAGTVAAMGVGDMATSPEHSVRRWPALAATGWSFAGRNRRVGIARGLIAAQRSPLGCRPRRPLAVCPVSSRRRQRISRLGSTPRRRATSDTLMPGSQVSATSCSFSARDQRLRRGAASTISISKGALAVIGTAPGPSL
ncbi:tyrosine-type recombinase/integrase (plasmid) [Azospirillum brasilense]|nr:tyrosine-type recombinase/integrase [Azospirillum brasilense]